MANRQLSLILILSVILADRGFGQGENLRQANSPIEERPNIIVVLADDLGYGDTSVYDGWVQTPNLQRMADEGLTFTDFHTNSSVCSPTRAAFLTGRYQQRVGIVDVIARHLDTPPLDPSQRTIARVLKDRGYQTALFGKWHLGMQSSSNPVHFGFNEFRGYLDGYIDYHNHARHWHHNLEIEPQPGYSTHLITQNSVRFIKDNSHHPFFLYVSHEAVHLPFQTPDDTLEARKPVAKEDRWKRERIRPKYKVMLEEMDKGIGEIFSTLHDSGIADRTLVFFFSDNGAIGAGSNQPFRGGKFSHYEGGHRVPAIAWWPGKIRAGSTCDGMAVAMDLLPTFAEIAGAKLAKETPPGSPDDDRTPDGISLANVLLSGAEPPPRRVFFGYEPKLGTAMRDGPWKMIIKEDRGQLFHLGRDPGEQNNLAETESERAASMRTAINRWKEETAYHAP
ncbi:MAG: sulfatase-like hydrolase/transferase [Rubripirellula sp.]|nr:sulfatase-like hydrolase/transferase [Rubripirellula sp.]